MTTPLDVSRLIFLMETVEREGQHLRVTTKRLFQRPIDRVWVEALAHDIALAERLDAFVARFGRMQDTLGDKLIPELRRQLLETPGSALDNLNRMEKLGLLVSVRDWVEARNLRNRRVHEYQRDADEFAGALIRARELVPLLLDTYNRINRHVRGQFASPAVQWPALLEPATE